MQEQLENTEKKKMSGTGDGKDRGLARPDVKAYGTDTSIKSMVLGYEQIGRPMKYVRKSGNRLKYKWKFNI